MYVYVRGVSVSLLLPVSRYNVFHPDLSSFLLTDLSEKQNDPWSRIKVWIDCRNYIPIRFQTRDPKMPKMADLLQMYGGTHVAIAHIWLSNQNYQ